MKTCEKIKKIRKEKGFTQKKLGEKTGIAESTIRRYEIVLLNPKFETIKRIADALECNVTELLGEEFGEMTENKTAKEMFEELGFKDTNSDEAILNYVIKTGGVQGYVRFYIIHRRYTVWTSDVCAKGIGYAPVPVEWHKAIHRQMEELGWL